MLRSRDKGQNNKRSLTFGTWSNFQVGWAQINWIIELIQKRYSFTYLGSQEVVNQGVKGQCPYMPIGYRPYDLWSLNFDPSFDQNRDIKAYKTIHFLNLQANPINLSPFSLKFYQLENLTPVQKVNDLLLF